MTSPRPFITIITPTYNAGKFIEKCIESVQHQTFKNFEHLILDGVSGDNTVQIVRALQQKYNSIDLKIEKDDGVFDAMAPVSAHDKVAPRTEASRRSLG